MSDTRQTRVLIWDIDGTLLDTREGLISAYQYTIRKFCLRHATPEELVSFIGPSPKDVFMQYFELSKGQAQEASDFFRERYKSRDLLKARLYPNAMHVLSTLEERGFKQTIATNKRQDYAEEIAEHFGLHQYCYPIYGADNFGRVKKANSIRQCMKDLGVDKENTMMIGDTEGDRRAAQETEVRFLGVNYGYGFRTEVDFANQLKDILRIIK